MCHIYLFLCKGDNSCLTWITWPINSSETCVVTVISFCTLQTPGDVDSLHAGLECSRCTWLRSRASFHTVVSSRALVTYKKNNLFLYIASQQFLSSDQNITIHLQFIYVFESTKFFKCNLDKSRNSIKMNW